MSQNRRKHRMDFVLFEGSPFCPKLTFRFYPARSHMHGFHDHPPEDFNGVYKVYYSWAVLSKDVDENGVVNDFSNVVFDMRFDECSALLGLENVIEACTNKFHPQYDNVEALSFGQPGSIWEIQRLKRGVWSDVTGEWMDVPELDRISFKVWNNYNNLGYRFSLSVDKAREFGDFIRKVNLYMLEHGEPI